MMKTRSISCLMAVLLALSHLSCSRDDAGGPSGPTGPVDVQVVVSNGDATRSAGASSTDNEIQRLRIYAFNAAGALTGYALADNLSGRTYVPMALSEGGDTYFYVIANDHFGPNPMVQDQSVNNWATLTQTDLQSVVFNLWNFAGWTQIDGKSISPMSNNRYKETSGELPYENDYATPVYVTGNSQIIPVTVQHVLGRLRLMFNKDASLGDEISVKLTRAAVYHRPDAFRLYNSGSDAIAFTDKSDVETLVDEFVSEGAPIALDPKPADSYTEVARTFLAPNPYGSPDAKGTAPVTDTDKAYRLELTVSFAYSGGGPTEKSYTVYLPPVARNAGIDVLGTFTAAIDDLTFNVMTNAWDEKVITVPPFM